MLFLQRLSAVTLLALVPAFMSCGDDDGSFKLGPEAQIDISPLSISFPDVPRGDTARRNVTVRHVGYSGTIKLDAVLETTSPDLEIGLIEKTELQPGEETRIQIVYTSGHDEPDLGSLVIKHNLLADPETDIPIVTPGQRAQLFAFPANVDFGIVQAGAPYTVNVEVRNGGTAPATLTGSIIDTESPGAQFIVDVPEGTVIPVDGSAIVPMTYAPAGRDADEATVTITTEREDVVLVVNLDGEEETPVITCVPALVNLGWTQPFETSGMNITCRNDGNTHLDVSSVKLEDAPSALTLAGRPTGPFTLLPGEAWEMGVLYSPTQEQPLDRDPLAKITIESSDAARNPLVVPVYGAAGEPSLLVIPASTVDFAFVAEGFVARREITVLNIGDSVTTVTDAELLDPTTPDEFSFPSDGDLPKALNPGESLTLELTFENKNGAEGTETARFLLYTDDPVVPEYPLNVIARRAQRPTCEAAFVPDLLAMGAYRPGTQGKKTLRVVNYGSGNCEFRDLEFDACLPEPFGISYEFHCDDNLAFNPFEMTSSPAMSARLGPGETFDFDVTFKAPALRGDAARDSYYARLFVTLFDPASGQLEFVAPPGGAGLGVNVRADVAAPLFRVEPGSIDFGLVRTDCSSEVRNVRLISTGPLETTVTGITLEGDCAGVVIDDLPATPFTIEGFSERLLHIRYAPDVVAEDTCVLKVDNDSANLPQGKVTLEGRGTDVTHQVDSFLQVPAPKVDVLFVVDDSFSMADDQERLKQNLPELVALAEDWSQDFHMAVTTTDTKGVQGRLKGVPPWVTNADDPAIFAQHLVVGTAGFYIERGLQGAYMALYNRNQRTDIPCLSNIPGQCPLDDGEGIPYVCRDGFCSGMNYGFLRDDAELVIIIISDEEDGSQATVDFYVDRFANLKKPNSGVGVIVHAIIITPAGCAGGFGTPGYRYVAAVEAFDGVVGDLCSPDFSEEFEDVGQRTFGLKDRFYPTLPPVPESIQVRVNGVQCNDGWSWNGSSRAVIFAPNSSCYPQFDDTVEIEYDVYCASPD